MTSIKSLYEQLSDENTLNEREELDIHIWLDRYRLMQAARRSAWLAGILFLLPILGAIFYSTRLEDTYIADAKLLFKAASTSALSDVTKREDAGLRSLLGDQTPLSTQTELLLSRPVLQKTIQEVQPVDNSGNLLETKDLRKKVEIEIIGGTDILQIKYEHSDPQIAAQLINTLIENYQEASLESRRSEMRQVKQFIAEQLPRVEENLLIAESELRTFLESNNVISIDEEVKTAVGTLDSMQQEIVEVQAAIEESRIRSEDLQTELQLTPKEALAIGRLSEASSVQSALDKLQGVNQEIKIKKARYKPDSPVMQRLITERDSITQLLYQEVEAVLGEPMEISSDMLYSDPIQLGLIENYIETELNYNSLLKRLETLNAANKNYQQRVASLPRLGQKQRALERQLSTTQETYQTLLRRLEEIQVQQDETINNSHLIEPAVVPTISASSKKAQVIALGVLAGTILSVSITLVASILTPGTRSQ
ncbi:MAG: hypothetical protein KTR27_13540 [Leptolyngbyaceae cyanobacterium MAG.088]|nr:hypothetical protein [Leptolyngbyaceae cyanobacterium MAG.088]